jgi:glycosyltransferase involved in cell wall biosynthesis
LLGDRYKNVVKIPYGVDLDRYAFIDERKDDGKTVGYVGVSSRGNI